MIKILLKLVGINPLTHRVESTKSIFKKAYKEALKAQYEIEKECVRIDKKRAKLNKQITHCEELRADNKVFIGNISKFI